MARLRPPVKAGRRATRQRAFERVNGGNGAVRTNLFAAMQPEDVYGLHVRRSRKGTPVSGDLIWQISLVFLGFAAVFVIGGATGRRQQHRVVQARRPTTPDQVEAAEDDPFAACIAAVLSEETPRAATQFTALEMAVAPGLAMHWDRQALSAALRLVVRDAISRASGGRVLVTASRHGGRVQIGVSDDGKPVDRETHEALLREPQQILALMGATMDVAPAPEGTTVALRLPEPGPIRNQDHHPTAVSATDRAVSHAVLSLPHAGS